MSEEQAVLGEESAPSEEVIETAETTEESAPSTEGAASPEESATSQPELETKAAESPEYQKRLNQMTREKYDLERKVTDLQRQASEASAANAQAPLAKPTLEQFDYDDEKFFNASVAYEVDISERKSQTEQANSQALRQEQTRISAYIEKVDEFKVDHPDFAEKIDLAKNVIGATETMTRAIMEMKDPALAYHLAGNIELADKLNKMSDFAMVAKLGELSAALASKPKPKQTTAPDPSTSLATGGKIESALPEAMRGGKYS